MTIFILFKIAQTSICIFSNEFLPAIVLAVGSLVFNAMLIVVI